jgi:hypothetical protein
MYKPFHSPTRRLRLAISTAASVFGLFLLAAPSLADSHTAGSGAIEPGRVLAAVSVSAAPEDRSIRPFQVNIPEAALADLRQRVLATRWPDKETVNDQSQGVQLAKLQGVLPR